jgi:transposase-like protein
MPRFLSEGIWENGYEDKHLDVLRSMRPGDRIAIKSSYTRKHGLPFDNRGWRKLMAEGGQEAVRSDDAVVSAAEVRELKKRIRQLERVLGKKTP